MNQLEIPVKKMSPPLVLPPIHIGRSARSAVTSEDDSKSCHMETPRAHCLRFENSAFLRGSLPNDQSVQGPQSSDTNLEELRKTFTMADKDGQPGLTMDEFVHAVKRTTTKKLSDDEIRLIFMKMDVNCDGTIDWTEYVTYHMFTHQVNSQLMQTIIERPFVNEMKSITAKTHEPIVSIVFFPHVTKHSTKYDYKDGKYVTLSKDGVISFWTLDMKHKVNMNINYDDVRVNKPWFLHMVCMYNASMLALATTDREFVFLDIATESFLKRFVITGLENCVTTMHFWSDLKDRRYAILAWGDTHGNTYALYFKVLSGGGLFASTSDKKDTAKRASYSEIMRGLVPHMRCYKLDSAHEDWVCQIRFVPQLNGFISCCQKSNTSMLVTDFIKNRTSMYFKVNKGLTCFDYCPVMNVIVTGGTDCVVRVWNPYLTNRAIAFLKGHTRPVIYVVVNIKRNHVLSVDKEKAINIFNLKDQTWVQHIGHRIIRLGPFPLTATFFNQKLQHLILATNHLGMMEQKYETKPTESISHKNPVVVSLYNKTFKYLVTACEGSVVSVWDIQTGNKVMQFINAHTSVTDGIESPVEITAMAFDSQEKRVLTGARNGTVKMWNFNNGSCLQEFKVPESMPIVAIICVGSEIYVTGWSRNVSFFIDGTGNDLRRTWVTRHHEDILCMAFQSPNVIATSSYDGDIVMWLRETGQAIAWMNAHVSDKIVDLTIDYRKKFSTVALEFSDSAEGSSIDDSNSCLESDRHSSFALETDRQNGGLFPDIHTNLVSERVSDGNTLAAPRINTLAPDTSNTSFSSQRRNSPSPRRGSSMAPHRSSSVMPSRRSSIAPERSISWAPERQINVTPQISRSWTPERRVSKLAPTRESLAQERRSSYMLSERQGSLTSERRSRDHINKFKRSLFADLIDPQDNGEVVVVHKKKPHDFYEHPLLWALDKSTIVSHDSKYRPRRKYPREDYDNLCKLYEAAVDTILFLETRDPQDKETAALMSAGAEGWVRAWSTHKKGRLLGQFNAGHEVGYSITHMVSDIANRYIVTSDSMGYVKVWDIVNYCTTQTMSAEELEEHKERMRDKFAFLKFMDQFEKSFGDKTDSDKTETSRPPPKTSNPEETLKTPPLLNSFRAHVQAVNYMNIVNDEYLITCSSDQSVRMWTLCGRYIGTFGETWHNLSDQTVPSDLHCSMPLDLRRTASAKTLWVLNGGRRPHWETALRVIRQVGVCRLLRQGGHHWAQKPPPEVNISKIEKKSVDIGSNILGVSYKRQMRHRMTPELPKMFDGPCNEIAVYHTLPFADLTPVEYKTDMLADINLRRIESHARRAKMKENALASIFDKMWPSIPEKRSTTGSRVRISPDRDYKDAAQSSARNSSGAGTSPSRQASTTSLGLLLKLPPIEKTNNP